MNAFDARVGFAPWDCPSWNSDGDPDAPRWRDDDERWAAAVFAFCDGHAPAGLVRTLAVGAAARRKQRERAQKARRTDPLLDRLRKLGDDLRVRRPGIDNLTIWNTVGRAMATNLNTGCSRYFKDDEIKAILIDGLAHQSIDPNIEGFIDNTMKDNAAIPALPDFKRFAVEFRGRPNPLAALQIYRHLTS